MLINTIAMDPLNEEEINKNFRFKTFPVYKDMRNFRKRIKDYTRQHFPKIEQYCLTSQLWRALDSVLLNIAEGSNRYTGKANSQFMNIAIGSLDESVSCIDSAFDDGYMDKEQQLAFQTEAIKILKQLRLLSSVIRRNNRSN